MIAESPNRINDVKVPIHLSREIAVVDLCVKCNERPIAIRKSKLCRPCYLKRWEASNPMCCFQGCRNHSYAKGMCRGHYGQRSFGRPLTELRRGNVQTMDDNTLNEFRREHMEYTLRLERDAYRCAVGVAARLAHRREVVRLEFAIVALKGGA